MIRETLTALFAVAVWLAIGVMVIPVIFTAMFFMTRYWKGRQR